MDITKINQIENWIEYTLTNDHGMSVSFLNYGGIITNISVPDKEDRHENIVLSYQNYEDYKQNPNYFGAIIGRVAGRVKNATFEMEGHPYSLKPNEGHHHLHGGENGFHQINWRVEPFQSPDHVGGKLCYTSAENESGYPGCVDVTVTYTLTNQNQFIIKYEATSTKDTILTLTNHTYFNLTGNAKNTIHQHTVTLPSESFLTLDKGLIPTGELAKAHHTPFDFRKGKRLEEGINSLHPQNKMVGNGYDHYFLLHQHENHNISVYEPESGRKITVQTTQPGLVMYTANHLDEGLALRNGPSKRYLGVCLETQSPPASLIHKNLPSIQLAAHQKYDETTLFTFSCE